VSASGKVTAGTPTTQATLTDETTLLGHYASSIAKLAKTPQFLTRLQDVVSQQSIFFSEAELAKKIEVTADKQLFRVTVQATANTPEQAEVLAQTAADVLIEQVAAEEKRVIDNVVITMDQQRAELLARLSALSQQRNDLLQSLNAPAAQAALDNLLRSGGSAPNTAELAPQFKAILVDLARITANPELALVNSRAEALEAELGEVTRAQESFAINLLQDDPIFVLNPVETVPTEATVGGLQKRDLLVLGAGAGLILGWLAANTAEQLRNGHGPWREPDEEEEETAD